ncbi:hypothetical protein B566_EDAN017824 [Ephemera danica]|nr:hypothetical protein B566_EDAN017824 [Ephemera danica]
MTNRAYNNEKDSKYPFLQRQEIVDFNEIFHHDLLIKNGFKLAYNDNLSYYFCRKANVRNNINLDECAIANFCEKFFYVNDNRDFESSLHSKLASHCKYKEENMNLRARLYYLVSQMYQHKIDPNQQDLANEFYRRIHYNVQRVHAQFAGRFKQIEEIKDALEYEKNKCMFDLLVTGMAGMGKTQLVLKYIEQNKQNHKNIIWINAESKESLEYCFDGIAKHCHLENNIQEIYSYLRHDTLFVFDNADKVLLAKNDKNEYIYLPNNAQCIERNKFIVISQDKKWTTSFIVNVDTLSEEDALEYLDETIKCSKEDKLKLAATYQYWPLALCLAVSYIKSQPEVQLGLKSYSDAISTLQTDNTKLHEHLPGIHEMEAYNISLKLLWQRFQKTLDSKEKLALKIVEIMSISDPDNFPIALLKFDDSSAENVNRAVLFLCNYSIVSISEVTISIHRTLQSVIKNSIISDTNHFENTLILGTECFTKYLKSMNDFEKISSAGNMHIATFLNVLLVSEVDIGKYIQLARMLLKKLKKNYDIGSDCKPNEIYDSIISKIEQKLRDIQLQTHDFLFEKSLILSKIGKYDESLNVFNKLIEIYTKELGENHLKTLNCMQRKAIVLHKMKNYDEALSILNQVIEFKKEILARRDYSAQFELLPSSDFNQFSQS